MLRTEGLGWRYAAGVRALHDLTLEVPAGEYVALSGPSGSGKSTLLRAFNGLIPHLLQGVMEGRVTVAGRDTRRHPVHELYEDVGLVFQNPDAQLFTGSVEREMAFGLESLGWAPARIRERLAEVAQALQIEALMGRAPASLSAGEKQLVALAAALTPGVRILLLDEPYAHLDPRHRRALRRQLQRLHQEGQTVVVAAHRLGEVLPEASHLALLDEGRLTAHGPTKEVLASPPEWLALPAWHPFESLEAALRAGHRPPEPASLSPPGQKVLLEAEDLSFAYGSGPPALAGVSFELREGECLALVGGNGSGKTTLLKHLNGLLRPAQGSVRIEGQDARRRRVAELATRVGLVVQNPNDQFFHATVEEEIRCGARHLGSLRRGRTPPPTEAWGRGPRPGRGVRGDATRPPAQWGSLRRGRTPPPTGAWIEELVELFGLRPLLTRHPHALSHGQKRRVSLAAVLALRPAVLALDEPTTGQDDQARRSLEGLLRRLLEEGFGLVLATHDLEFAERLAHRWLVLAEGRPLALASPEEVMADEAVLKRAGLEPTDRFLLTQGVAA